MCFGREAWQPSPPAVSPSCTKPPPLVTADQQLTGSLKAEAKLTLVLAAWQSVVPACAELQES